jgi:hypothetical protein
VIIAGEPVFTTVGGVDLRIVPLQVVRSGLHAAAGRADPTVRPFGKRIHPARRHVGLVAAD